VVEVVSSSNTDQKSRDRDYREKRLEYETRGIPEYWIIDPMAAVVIILTLKVAKYQEQQFTQHQRLNSPLFPDLNLTAEQVLRAGK
jgi:Uma2 family endonuclease